MHLYHYTSIANWDQIHNGDWQHPELTSGLRPKREICSRTREDPTSQAYAVFGLLDPEPESWTHNVDFPDTWERLMTGVGRLLLSYEATDEIIDKSYIIDWSHRERILGWHADDKDLQSQASYTDRVAAEEAYWASRLPLAEYIERPELITEFSLPEVVTLCSVPSSAIAVADTQPRMLNMASGAKRAAQRAIRLYPELKMLSEYID